MYHQRHKEQMKQEKNGNDDRKEKNIKSKSTRHYLVQLY